MQQSKASSKCLDLKQPRGPIRCQAEVNHVCPANRNHMSCKRLTDLRYSQPRQLLCNYTPMAASALSPLKCCSNLHLTAWNSHHQGSLFHKQDNSHESGYGQSDTIACIQHSLQVDQFDFTRVFAALNLNKSSNRLHILSADTDKAIHTTLLRGLARQPG